MAHFRVAFLAKNHFWTEKPESVVRAAFFCIQLKLVHLGLNSAHRAFFGERKERWPLPFTDLPRDEVQYFRTFP